MHGMRRAILAAGVFLLVVACGASGGGPAGPGTVRPAVVHVDPLAAPPPPARPRNPPPRARPRPRRPRPPPPAAQPAGSARAPSPGSGSAPAVDDGSIRPCPMGTNPPLHKLCPV